MAYYALGDTCPEGYIPVTCATCSSGITCVAQLAQGQTPTCPIGSIWDMQQQKCKNPLIDSILNTTARLVNAGTLATDVATNTPVAQQQFFSNTNNDISHVSCPPNQAFDLILNQCVPIATQSPSSTVQAGMFSGLSTTTWLIVGGLALSD